MNEKSILRSVGYVAPQTEQILSCAETFLCASTNELSSLDKEEFDFDWEY